MAAALGQGSVSVAFPASFLSQFVSVVLDVGLLFQTPVICLSRFQSHDPNIPDRSDIICFFLKLWVGVLFFLSPRTTKPDWEQLSHYHIRSPTLLTYISVDDYGVLAVGRR